MIHIKIEGPSMDYELDVDASDVVYETLEVYSEDVDDPQESQHYEPAFIIGEAIPLNKGKTFAECSIKPGDTLYHLLGMAKEDIPIPNKAAVEDKTIPASLPGTSSQGDTIPVGEHKIHILKALGEHPITVCPTDVVDPILREHAVALKNPAEACYYEPIFMTGQLLITGSLDGESETFAQRGIKDGDTTYILQRDRRYVVVQNEFKDGQRAFVHCALHLPLRGLIKALQLDEQIRVIEFSEQDLALRCGDILMDELKTLDDYNMLRETTIFLCLKCRISIGLLKYTKMEQVLFKPQDTIADVKNEILGRMPNIEYATKVRESYPVPLKGMVNIPEKGTTSYVYLDVFSDKMEMFLIGFNGENRVHDCKCSISSASTLNDICELIRTQYDKSKKMNYPRRLSRWPKGFAFDDVWMRTFAPQIVAEPLSSSTAMPLFFFPLRVEIVRSVKASPPSILVKDFAIMFCKEQLGLEDEGVRRLIYHPQSGDFLRGKLTRHLDKLQSDGESYSVLLMKPPKRRLLGKRSGTSTYITVVVRWEERTAQFEVESTDTISVIQDDIERHVQVPYFMQILMFNGEPLVSNRTFVGIGVEDCSKLDLSPLLD